MVFVAELSKQKLMSPDNQDNKIIGNESNTEYEIEPRTTRKPGQTSAEENNLVQQPVDVPTGETQPFNNDLATNDGSVLETLDTAFHNKPGVAEGENPSGSDRADYYESREQGKSDAEKEVDEAGRESNA